MHIQVPVLLEHLSDKYVGQYGMPPTAEDIQMWRYSVYLLYWYKSTNTDAAARRRLPRTFNCGGTQFTCFTGTKVQILTQQALQALPAEYARRLHKG
jgi:hypothetical protein